MCGAYRMSEVGVERSVRELNRRRSGARFMPLSSTKVRACMTGPALRSKMPTSSPHHSILFSFLYISRFRELRNKGPLFEI
jgi:hypothetical protein